MSVETADSAFIKGNSLFVDEQFEEALKYYNTAIELEADNAEFWIKRSACHFQLKNFAGAMADANKATSLDPKNYKGYFRKGVAAFAEEEYESAKAAFEKGLPLAPNPAQFKTWIRKCQAELDAEEEDAPAPKPAAKPAAAPAPAPTPAAAPVSHQPAPAATTAAPVAAAPAAASTKVQPHNPEQAPQAAPRIRHEWFQTETHVTVSIFIKGAKKEDVVVDLQPKSLNVSVKQSSGSEVQVDFDLADKIVPSESKYEVLSTKIEIKMKKDKAARWTALEDTGDGNAVRTWDVTSNPTTTSSAKLYPSSKGNKDWDKIGATEEEDRLEGDAALNKVFKDIYGNASDDQRRAMLKSFYESGGTVLSTNWDEVGKGTVKGTPPEGLEMKKWSDNK